MQSPTTPIVLTIAGSDSGGGAGIQADIKAISATGSYACSVITAVTAQNTLGVTDIFPIPLRSIEQQLDAVLTDLNVVAVKVGMLANAEIIKLVAQKIQQYKIRHLVVDPVMVATSGDLLLDPDAITTLTQELLPLADLITPNLPEACQLTNRPYLKEDKEIFQLIDQFQQYPFKATLLKGGHLTNQTTSTDYLIQPNQPTQEFRCTRIDTNNTHGTGCTLSSAIASYLAQGKNLTTAVELAKKYITSAIIAGSQFKIGQGNSPVNHFFMLKK